MGGRKWTPEQRHAAKYSQRSVRAKMILEKCIDSSDANDSKVWDVWQSWYCDYHQILHCNSHHYKCVKEGRLQLSLDRYERRAFMSGKTYKSSLAEECRRGDIELCKIFTWSDQLDFNIFHCAECGNKCCNCRYDDSENVGGTATWEQLFPPGESRE